MKILLVGEIYSANLGDPLIHQCVEGICKEVFKGCEILSLDISGGSDIQKRSRKASLISKIRGKLRSSLRKKLPFLLSNYEYAKKNRILQNMDKMNLGEIDLVIFVGGQLFMDYFAISIHTIVKKLSKHSIPIVFNSCGVGRNSTKITQNLLRKSVNSKNVIAISLRDNLNNFKNDYYSTKDTEIKLTLDSAFELEYFFDVKNNKTNKVGVGVMGFDSIKNNKNSINEADYIGIYEHILAELETSGTTWEFFTNGSPGDHEYAKLLSERFEVSEKIKERPGTTRELVDTIACYDKIISFRLHSHIVANALGIPSVGYVWDKKVREFADSIGNNHFIDFDDKAIENTKHAIKWLLSEHAFARPPEGIKTSEFLKSIKIPKRR